MKLHLKNPELANKEYIDVTITSFTKMYMVSTLIINSIIFILIFILSYLVE